MGFTNQFPFNNLEPGHDPVTVVHFPGFLHGPEGDFNTVPFQVTGTRPTEDGEGLLADIVVSGKVTSAVCDITPGDQGKITQIHASVNSEPAPDRVVTVNSTKNSSRDDLRRPLPYEGSFNRTFSGVPVIEGNNVFALLAMDPVYQLPGSVHVPLTITASPPAGVVRERSLAVEFPSSQNTLANNQIRLIHSRDGVRVIDGVILESVSPTRYVAPAGTVTFEMQSAPALNDAEVEIISGTVWDEDSPWETEHFPVLTEYAPDRSNFTAANGGVESISYTGWSVTLGGIGTAESTGEGEFRPMVLKLSGPESLLENLDTVKGKSLRGQPPS